MERRDFFKLLIGTPFVLASPISQASSVGKTLILIELSGGNDGLNTLIHFRDKHYYQYRPTLALQTEACIPLSESLALNSALTRLHPWWKKGNLAWVQGVGYPHPNRSHFSSLDIWESGSGAEQSLATGWLAKVIPQLHIERHLDGISLANDLGPLNGLNNSLLLTDVQRFLNQANQLSLSEPTIHQENQALTHIQQVAYQAKRSAFEISQLLGKSPQIPLNFPDNAFGKRLALAAQLLIAGVKTPVIKVSIGSFDTHNNQYEQHQRLLTNLAAGLDSFAQTLVAHNLWQDTLIMTYSEFGRRVIENASQGTDHGTAAPHLVMGGAVKGGLYGAQPKLTDLDNGDLRFTTDFRQLYATLTHHWWGIDNHALQTKGFSAIPLLKNV